MTTGPDDEDGVACARALLHTFARTSATIRGGFRSPIGSFEAVLSCGVLEHVEDPDASLEEIRRVLVPGGTFYVYKLPNRTSYLEAIARGRASTTTARYEHDRVYDERIGAGRCSPGTASRCKSSRRMNMLPLTVTGRVADRAAVAIWAANRALSVIPGLNRLATNVELVARDVSHR